MPSFRDGYLTYAELTAVARGWAERHPDLVRLRSLAVTPEGRDVWLLVVGRDPDRARPAVLVDANQHASEVAGSSAALAIAEAFLALHTSDAPDLHGLPERCLPVLRDALLYVIPRVSPDGVERVLGQGAYVRSVPRDARPARQRARWVGGDVDGDGQVLLLRRRDPLGDLVESSAVPGLLVPRDVGDEGPFWKAWPEGTIEGFDGVHVPSPDFLSDNAPDLNRNFPYDWRPEPEQAGAGEYPGSEPESRALIELATASPHLFAWIDLHTFGGVFIRPLGAKPDTKLDPADLAVYRRLEQWAVETTGYPMVSGFEEFTYEPETPLRGDLTEYAYHQRACLSFVVELWDLFEQVGLARPKRFVDRYDHLDRADLERIARWAHEKGGDLLQRPWVAVDHPQLGPVEVGGLDPRFSLWNPPPDRLAGVCRGQVAMTLRIAALAPRLAITDVSVVRLEDGWHRVEATVCNEGYLPTWVVAPGRSVPHGEPVVATCETDDGVLADPAAARVEVGQLDGWGRGRFSRDAALYFQRSRGTTGMRRVSWVVRGTGKVRIRAGSCRTGFVEAWALL